MATWLRLHIWQLALSVFALALLVAGLVAVQPGPTEADAGMPAEQRIYWSWVGSLNQGADSALQAGLDLLQSMPHLQALYLRLAEVCEAAAAHDACRTALEQAQPPDATTRLYREAALALLLPEAAAEAASRWQRLARDPALDPTLARMVVDRASRKAQPPWLDAVEADWRRRLDADSTAVGPAFGLGYAAVRRGEWNTAEGLLRRVARLAPDDPQAYRELGRIYYVTAQPDKFDAALAAGIVAAEARHDQEQALILRGNLGWNKVLRRSDLEQAEQLLAEALEQSRTLADEETAGFNYYRLAYVYLAQHRYDEALPLLDSAAVRYARFAPRQHPEVLVLRANTLSRLFRFSDAEDVLEAAIAEAEERRNVDVKIQALSALTVLRRQMGRYAAARQAGLEALALAQEYQTRNHELILRTSLGEIERRGGNFEAARGHLEAAMGLANETKNDAQIENISLRLGRIALDLQDANAAKRYFETMLDRAGEAGRQNLAKTYAGLGQTYQAFQNHIEALRYFDLALAQLGEEEKYTESRVSLRLEKAGLFISTGSYDEAEVLLGEAEREAANDPITLYFIALSRGKVALFQERYAAALQHFQKAEAIEREYHRPSRYLHVLFGKALSYWRLRQQAQAEAAFQEAIGIIETLRANLRSPSDRSYFVQDKVEIYEHFAAFLEEQGRSEEALYYTERARSRGLVDLLYTTLQGQEVDVQRPAGRFLELERRLRALAEVIDDFDRTDVPAAYEATQMAQLRREYERADAMYRQARIDLAPDEKTIYTFEPIPPDAARAVLAEGEALIVYDLRGAGQLRDGDASVAYVVLPDAVIVRPLTLQQDALGETIRFLRDQIGTSAGQPGTDWEPAARRLYQALMAPVLDAVPASVRHLHLMLEGVLHYLPFASLLDPEGRFLMERYTLSIAPSASILKLNRARNPRRWDSMLLLADPNGQLPGTRQEALSIQAEAPDHRRALVGHEATQARLEQHAGQYDILHFATHGRFVSQAPWQSSLDLHDDVLSVEEIGELDLNAYLVTLSACETALGGGLLSDVPNGDEWVGLNQAFLAAGTPTVMASLWPIDDRISSSFMISFYEALGSAGKAHALAQVQRRFIQDSHTRHPFYWAPFTVIGDPL